MKGFVYSLRMIWGVLDDERGPRCPEHDEPLVPDAHHNLAAECCGLLIPDDFRDRIAEIWGLGEMDRWVVLHGGVVLVLERRPPPKPRRKR